MAQKDNANNTTKAGEFNPWISVYAIMDQHVERVDAMVEEMNRRQQQAVEQASRAIGELTKMTQDSIAFSSQMTQEWVKAARGTTRWASDFLGTWNR